METKILTDNKEQIKIQIDNLTLAELLRVYLNKDEAVRFAAWRREHPSKPLVLNIKTSGKSARKALQDAINKIEKDTDKLLAEFRKSR